jgi:hypothetical protein
VLREGTILAAAILLAACGSKTANEQEQTAATANGNQVLTGREAGVTPMAQRVAEIGVLNKRNGLVKTIRLHPGQSARWKDAIVRLRACETTAPWEQEKLTGAFLQLDVQGSDKKYRRVFSGWVYKESPSLNVVEHPVYDVWPKSCAMTFPPGAPAPPGAAPSTTASRAQKSPGPERAAEPPAAESPSPSAVANNAE